MHGRKGASPAAPGAEEARVGGSQRGRGGSGAVQALLGVKTWSTAPEPGSPPGSPAGKDRGARCPSN